MNQTDDKSIKISSNAYEIIRRVQAKRQLADKFNRQSLRDIVSEAIEANIDV